MTVNEDERNGKFSFRNDTVFGSHAIENCGKW